MGARFFQFHGLYPKYMLVAVGLAAFCFGSNEEYYAQLSEYPDTIWVSSNIDSPIPTLMQGIFRYKTASTMVIYDSIPDVFLDADSSLANPLITNDHVYLVCSNVATLSRIMPDTSYINLHLSDFVRISSPHGSSRRQYLDVSYDTQSNYQREQHIVYMNHQLYILLKETLDRHFWGSDYEHNQQGYDNAKSHLTEAYGSQYLSSTEECFAVSNNIYQQSTYTDAKRVTTMDLPGYGTVWGTAADSTTRRQIDLGRVSFLERSFPVENARCMSRMSSELLILMAQYDRIFAADSSVYDTLYHNKTMYLYVHPILSRETCETRRGLIFMLPVVGKLACSLYVGSTPTLEEFAWATADAAFIAASWYFRPLASNSTARDVANRTIQAATTSDRTAPFLLERPATSQLQALMMLAGKPVNRGPIHHIVSLFDRRAAVVRDILHKYGVDLNDAVNLVSLPTHAGRHSASYYRQLESLLLNASSRRDVIQVLNRVSDDLLSGAMQL